MLYASQVQHWPGFELQLSSNTYPPLENPAPLASTDSTAEWSIHTHKQVYWMFGRSSCVWWFVRESIILIFKSQQEQYLLAVFREKNNNRGMSLSWNDLTSADCSPCFPAQIGGACECQYLCLMDRSWQAARVLVLHCREQTKTKWTNLHCSYKSWAGSVLLAVVVKSKQ